MDSNSKWTQFFHISEEIINRWQTEAADKKSLLLWCLENGALEPHEYLDWARSTFNLPSLGTQFFNNNRDLNFWSKLKNQVPWSEEFVPISEWDGIVYIGCLQPQLNSDYLFPVQYVLVHIMDLKNHWKILNSHPTKNFSSDVNTSVLKANEWENKLNDWANTLSQTEVTEFHAADTPEFNDTQNSAIHEADVPVIHHDKTYEAHSLAHGDFTKMTSSQNQDMKVESSIQHENHVSQSKPVTMPVSTPVSTPISTRDHATQITITPSSVGIEDQPEGLSLSLHTPTAKPFDPIEELRQSLGVNDESLIKESSANTMDLNLDAPEGMNFSAKKEKIVTSHLKSDLVAPMPGPTPIHPMPGPTSVQTPQPAHIPAPSQIQSSAITATASNEAMENTGTYTGFLTEFYTHFRAGMVLDVENETYIPVMWNEGFKRTNTESIKRYSLNEASCFRIAYRTQMPYVGYVVNTSQNVDFFTSFGMPELPQSVLVQPVIINKKVVALLLATFDTGKKMHHILTAGEDLARKYIENQKRLGIQAA